MSVLPQLPTDLKLTHLQALNTKLTPQLVRISLHLLIRGKSPLQFDEIRIRLSQIIKNTHELTRTLWISDSTMLGLILDQFGLEFKEVMSWKLRFTIDRHMYLILDNTTRPILDLHTQLQGSTEREREREGGTRLDILQHCNFMLFTICAIMVHFRPSID